MENCILVLNMGLKSIRSIIFDMHGNKLSFSALPIETYLTGDHVTQDPDEWWDKAKCVIKESIKDDEIRHAIKYITVTASSACLVPVDVDGEALDKSIMVSDKRAIKESKILGELDSFISVKEETGLNTDPYLMIPKILWVKHHETEVYEKAFKFLSPNDYLIGKLSGRYVTDYFNAQKYHYSMKTREYPAQILKELHIDVDKFPEVVAPGTNIGLIKKKFAMEMRLNSNVECIITTYDAICAFFGSGPSEDGDACDVSGTVTSLRVMTDQHVNDKLDRILTTPFIDQNIYIVGGSNNLGGGLIEWVKQCYYQNESYAYEIMEKEAKESGLGAGGLIFLPYLLGERAPIWDANARGVYFGIERTHTRKDMTRAVFESAGFCIKNMVDAIEDNGVKVRRIRVSGGLARINLISQVKADITGKEILVVDEFETTALGAAILVGWGTGLFEDLRSACKEFVDVRMIIKPNMKNYERYDKLYKLYNNTYNNLKDLYVERIRIIKEIYRETEAKIQNL